MANVFEVLLDQLAHWRPCWRVRHDLLLHP